jgi:Beta-glucosidase (SUN family)
VWGSKDSPVGNWVPYVAGANVDHSGQTFVKLGWNPIYLEDATPFKDEMPKWGVKIECDGDGCNGLPCAIDPAHNKVNEMVGSSSNGAGGGAFCVVTVPKGVNANFVVFDGSGGGGHGGSAHGGSDPIIPAPSAAPSSSDAPSSTYEAPFSSISSGADYSSSVESSATATAIDESSSGASPTPMYSPHEFFENTTSTYAVKSATVTSSMSQTSPISPATTGGASAAQLSIGSLVMSSLIVFLTVSFSS